MHVQCPGSCDNYMKTCASKLLLPRLNPEFTGSYAIPAILAGLLGGSLLEIAHAEANEVNIYLFQYSLFLL